MSALRLLLFIPLLAGCGGNVVVDGTPTATTTTGTGLGGAITTSTGFGGESTTTGFTTTTSTSTGFTTTTAAASSSSSSSGGGCVGSIQLSDDSGSATLTSMCAGAPYNPEGSTTPIGYRFAGGPVGGVAGMTIIGCASAAPMAQGLQLTLSGAMGDGDYMNGSAQYVDAMGEASQSTPMSPLAVSVFDFGAVGQLIQGKFAVQTQTQGPAIILRTVAGSFQVCRVPDELAP